MIKQRKRMLFSIIVIGIFVSLFIAYLNADPYKKYRAQSLEKQAGTMEHKIYEDETTFQSIYYPVFNDEILDAQVNSFVDEVLNNKEAGNIHYVDYTSSSLFNQYMQIVFTYKVYDEDEKEISHLDKRIGYDIVHHEPIDRSHVIRETYKKEFQAMVSKQLPDVNIDDAMYELKETSFILHASESTMEIPYDDVKYWLAIKCNAIDTLAPKDIQPKKTYAIDPSKPMISFTFDDGPNPQHTTYILDVLKQYDITATFFVLGEKVAKNEAIVKRMVEEGHEVANHSLNHSNLSKLSEEEIKTQINTTQDLIFQAGGEESMLVRPPYGAISQTMIDVSQFPFALWSIDSLDWRSRNVQSIKDQVVPMVQDGAIILMHDIYETSAQAFAEMVPILKDSGYQFVTYSDLKKYR